MILGLYPEEEESIIAIKSKRGREDAANKMQWKFVKGFDDANISTSIINAPYIGTFPFGYKDILYRGGKFSHVKGASDISVPFINLPFINYLSKLFFAKKEILKWIKQNNSSNKAVILYALNSYMGSCARYIKKVSPDTKICLIVPDLPEYAYNTTSRSLLFRYFIRKEIERAYSFFPYIDCFVGLTAQMHCRLDPNKPFCVVDTIIDKTVCPVSLDQYKNNKKTFTYTGTLAPRYGLKDFVEAFMLVEDPDLQMIICGSGPQNMESYLHECSNKDPRIRFLGLMPYKEVCDIQQKSFMLINPRSNDSEYTAYSFPSKVAEYMSTGIPVLIYRLTGIAEEYYDKTYQFDDYNSISDAIMTLSKTDRTTLWERAYKGVLFVEKEKSPKVQSQKVYDLIKSLF